MKEIDGLIAWSHYGVIEWLCTYDQAVDGDVACKRSAWSCGGDTCNPHAPQRDAAQDGKALALGTPHVSTMSGLCRCPGATSSDDRMEQISRFIQWHWVTKTGQPSSQPGLWAP